MDSLRKYDCPADNRQILPRSCYAYPKASKHFVALLAPAALLGQSLRTVWRLRITYYVGQYIHSLYHCLYLMNAI